MMVMLVTDHRIVDGAGGQMAAIFQGILFENPVTIALTKGQARWLGQKPMIWH